LQTSVYFGLVGDGLTGAAAGCFIGDGLTGAAAGWYLSVVAVPAP